MIPVEEHIKQIIELIPNKPIFNFKDVFVYYKGCTRQWAYALDIDKNDTIKGLIYDNKRKGVTSLLSKWITSNNATLEIAAMRLLADDEERKMLSMNHTDVTTNGKDIKAFNLPDYMRKDLEDGESEL